MTTQLALPFAHAEMFVAAEFIAAPSNEDARAWLERTGVWPGGRLALSGPAGSGKSHLVHIWARGRSAAILHGPLLREVGWPASDIAIDNADQAADEPLLHVLNAAAEAGQAILLAGRAAPARWPVRLPDLASRLRAMTAAEIGPPEDALLTTLLARLLADRQLVVAQPVQEWLLLRLPRTAQAVREAAARLDRAALATGRAVTRALAAEVAAKFAEP